MSPGRPVQPSSAPLRSSTAAGESSSWTSPITRSRRCHCRRISPRTARSARQASRSSSQARARKSAGGSEEQAPPYMRTLKFTLAYDGTRLVGWQRQAEGDSVQGLLEDALARFEGAPVTVHGAGRTDAGVHALGQVASVQVACTHDVTTLTRALNAQLPEDVRVLAI